MTGCVKPIQCQMWCSSKNNQYYTDRHAKHKIYLDYAIASLLNVADKATVSVIQGATPSLKKKLETEKIRHIYFNSFEDSCERLQGKRMTNV